jgi:hypothetical protein
MQNKNNLLFLLKTKHNFYLINLILLIKIKLTIKQSKTKKKL